MMLWIIGSYTANAQLVINEVCSSNDESYIDNNGDSPDWIELYNNTNSNKIQIRKTKTILLNLRI